MYRPLYELAAGFNALFDLVLDESMDLELLEEGLQSIECEIEEKCANGIALIKSLEAYAEAYGKEHIQERHRHRFEFNNDYEKEFEKHGMMCVGRNPESDLVEIVEIPSLKWYIGTQFHPEYQSTVLGPHPLFLDFVKNSIENQKNK